MQLVPVTHRCSLPAREGPSQWISSNHEARHRYRDHDRDRDPAMPAPKQCQTHLAKPLLHDLPHLPPDLLAPRETHYRGSAQPDTRPKFEPRAATGSPMSTSLLPTSSLPTSTSPQTNEAAEPGRPFLSKIGAMRRVTAMEQLCTEYERGSVSGHSGRTLWTGCRV
jgi:hypothetical protein